MALFGITDKNIPLLTWACQIGAMGYVTSEEDVAKQTGEILRICRRVAPGAEIEVSSRLATVMKLCFLTYRILTELADSCGEDISVDHLARIRQLNEQLRSDMVTQFSRGSEKLKARADSVVFSFRNDEDNAARITATAILDELTQLFPHKVHSVRRCDVCNHPFVSNKSRSQIYCSARCSAVKRVRDYRLRREEKENSVTGANEIGLRIDTALSEMLR